MQRCLLAVLAAAAFLATAPAFGQGDAKEQAKAVAARGAALYQDGKYLDAAAVFEEANAIAPHPNYLFNAAKAYEKAAEYQKALGAYRSFLDLYEAQNGIKAPEAADVERTIAVMKDKAFLALPEVTIDSDPTGADIYVDDPVKVLGQTPFTTHLAEGSHKVQLKKGGYQGFEKEFVVRSREPLRLTFALEKIKNEGGLRFAVNIRKARIYVDGKVQAVSPFNDTLRVDAGPHQVMVEKERYNQVTQTVAVEAGKTSHIHATLFLTNPPFSWLGYVGIASAVIGAAGITTGALVFRPRANREFKGTGNHNLYKSLTYAGYGGGGAMLGIGAGLLVWEFVRTDVDSDDLVRGTDVPPVQVSTDGQGVYVGATARF